jgi:uncharacterized protein YndB with AHSA1/START domain
MAKQRSVELSKMTDATPEAVFRALTHPLELSYWFCHDAWTMPKPGGDFWVRWRNGWWARGVYLMVERPRRIELTWQGKDEPGETDLAFEIDALEEGTAVRVTHSGYGADAVWDKAVAEAESSWPLALDNLASVLGTGIDLRLAGRPLLGVVPEELTLERAVKEGLSVDNGIYLTSVLANGPAAEAGLKKGDVITSIGGLAVTDWDSLTTTLARYKAGDRISVRYVRGDIRGFVDLGLKARPMPEVSFDPPQVVMHAREQHATVMLDLRQALAGLSEHDADKKLPSDEWSVKETLAHLSVSVRFTQMEIADLISGKTYSQFDGNPTAVPEVLAMTLATAPTLEELLNRLEQDLEETMALFAALRPEIVAMKARYRDIATRLLLPDHFREHVNHIKTTIHSLVSKK